MLITLRDLGNFLYKAIIGAVRLVHSTSKLCRPQHNNYDSAQLESGRLSANACNNKGENNDKLKCDMENEASDGKFLYHSFQVMQNFL